jgi:hypothetical protein
MPSEAISEATLARFRSLEDQLRDLSRRVRVAPSRQMTPRRGGYRQGVRPASRRFAACSFQSAQVRVMSVNASAIRVEKGKVFYHLSRHKVQSNSGERAS